MGWGRRARHWHDFKRAVRCDKELRGDSRCVARLADRGQLCAPAAEQLLGPPWILPSNYNDTRPRPRRMLKVHSAGGGSIVNWRQGLVGASAPMCHRPSEGLEAAALREPTLATCAGIADAISTQEREDLPKGRSTPTDQMVRAFDLWAMAVATLLAVARSSVSRSCKLDRLPGRSSSGGAHASKTPRRQRGSANFHIVSTAPPPSRGSTYRVRQRASCRGCHDWGRPRSHEVSWAGARYAPSPSARMFMLSGAPGSSGKDIDESS